jgi:hypothetical protein
MQRCGGSKPENSPDQLPDLGLSGPTIDGTAVWVRLCVDAWSTPLAGKTSRAARRGVPIMGRPEIMRSGEVSLGDNPAGNEVDDKQNQPTDTIGPMINSVAAQG